MLVLVCEFVTGGGLRREALSPSLAAEGALMRDALIADLEDLPGIDVVTTHDDRLPPPPRGMSRAIDATQDVLAIWAGMAAEADLAWPIAPETDGVLEAVATRLRSAVRLVLISDTATLRICARKSQTSAHLSGAGVPVLPVWRMGDVPPYAAGPFVVKPDDGAGCLHTRLCGRDEAMGADADSIVQPYEDGAAESLAVLCQHGRATVLSVNRQHVKIVDGRFGFHGVTVGIRPPSQADVRLAQLIHDALPGLHGVIGIDYVATPAGPVVIEVNPRLTTSYAGLRRALGINVLGCVAELIHDGAAPARPHIPSPTPVEVLV